MAQLNITISIADADLPRLLAAARDTFESPDLDKATLVELLRQQGISLIREMVRSYERRVAIRAAEALEPQIEVT